MGRCEKGVSIGQHFHFFRGGAVNLYGTVSHGHKKVWDIFFSHGHSSGHPEGRGSFSEGEEEVQG